MRLCGLAFGCPGRLEWLEFERDDSARTLANAMAVFARFANTATSPEFDRLRFAVSEAEFNADFALLAMDKHLLVHLKAN